METILEIKNLTKFFGKNKVVDSVNLEVKAGEIFGFLRTKWSTEKLQQ